MFLCCYRLQGEFREGFRDTDDGLELTDCDGDGRALVGVDFDLVDFLADADEMGGEFLCCVW